MRRSDDERHPLEIADRHDVHGYVDVIVAECLGRGETVKERQHKLAG